MNTIENVKNRSELKLMQLMLVQKWLMDEKKNSSDVDASIFSLPFRGAGVSLISRLIVNILPLLSILCPNSTACPYDNVVPLVMVYMVHSHSVKTDPWILFMLSRDYGLSRVSGILARWLSHPSPSPIEAQLK